jgi:hypothetical protein
MYRPVKSGSMRVKKTERKRTGERKGRKVIKYARAHLGKVMQK